MAGQARIIHPGNRRIRFEPPGDRQGIFAMSRHSQMKSLQALKRQEPRKGAHRGPRISQPMRPDVHDVGDIAQPFEGLGEYIPDMVKEGAMELARGVMDTGPAKYAAKYMEENPRAARNIAMAINTAELLPIGRLATGGGGEILNAGIQEVKTHLPGFYAGGPQSVQAFSKGVVEGVPNALKTAVSPQMRAQRREVGTGQTRVNEFLGDQAEGYKAPKPKMDKDGNPIKPAGNKLGTERGNLVASSYMGKQMDNRVEDKTLMDFMPTVRSEMGEVAFEGSPTVLKQMKVDAPDMPDHIAEKFLDRARNDLEPKGLLGNLADRNVMGTVKAALPHVSNVGNRKKPKIEVVRSMQAKGSDLMPESAGIGQVGNRGLQWMRNQNMLDAHTARLGREMDTMDTKEFLDVAALFERGRVDKFRKGLRPEDAKKGKADLFNDYWDAKKVDTSADVLTPQQRVAYDKAAARLEKGEKLPKTVQKAYDIGEAKMKQGHLSDDKKKLVKYIDDYLDKNGRLTAIDPDDPSTLWYRSSYGSTAQDLGGVGGRLAIDTKNKRIYSSINDGHDMFGMDPAGGVGLNTYTPPQQMGYGNAFYDTTGLKNKDALEWDRMVQLGEKSGIPPKVELYKRGPKKGQPNLESRESVREYEKRVLKEYKAKASFEDYYDAANNATSMGLLATPNGGTESEGVGY